MERKRKLDEMTNPMLTAQRKRIDSEVYLHYHDFYEIEYIISGTGTYEINGNPHPCTPGFCCLMSPLDYHRIQNPDIEIYHVMFSDQFVDLQLLSPFVMYNHSNTWNIDSETRPFIERIIYELIHADEQSKYRSTLINCLLLKFSSMLDISPQKNTSTFLQIHSYILNNYPQNITLESVAAHVGLTPSYVSSLFKKEMQVGFKTYLSSLRLDYARKSLTNTEKPISQICEESGFVDLPNFIKQFKARYGATPTVIRKIMQKEKP